ncbi:DUF4232 domain-containing protein [Streptomyces sp. NPDC086787]|uniref:DUF4232 domain-containing protein n=1 Tax=Streptomyces sp. NPDC086787 TaxID=3365759 RepID=UPI00380C4384
MPARRTARATRLFAAAGVAIAALSLTACNDGSGPKDEGAAKTSATATGGGAATGTGGASDTGSGTSGSGTSASSGSKGTGSSGGSAGSAGSGSSTKGGSAGSGRSGRVTCNGSNTKVTAQTVSHPLNHMLITVKNTGSKTCDLTYYPVLRFDEMQWVPQADEDSHPQAVTTLAPGESGYAGVQLSAADGSGQGGMTGKRLTVAFQGRTPNSSGGASATPTLPSKGVYYDSSLQVTYWQSDADTALNF